MASRHWSRTNGPLAIGPTLLGGLLLACGAQTEDPGSDSSTHFFDSCEADRDCEGDYSCQCNRCTLPCTSDDQCNAEGAMCLPATHLASCELVGNVCAPFEGVPASQEPTVDEPNDAVDAGVSSPPDDFPPALMEGSEPEPLPSPTPSETDAAVGLPDDAGSPLPEPVMEPVEPAPVPEMIDSGAPFVPDEPVTPEPVSEPAPVDPGPAETECPGAPECAWRELPSLPSGRRGHALLEIDGTLWSFGGDSGIQEVSSLELGATEWVDHEPMPTGAYSLGAQRMGDRVLVQTGYSNTGFVNTLQQYTLAEDTWVELAPMPSYRYIFATGVVDDRLYVIGGHGPANGTQVDMYWDYKGLVQVYDALSDTWSDATPEPEPTAGAASCTLGTKIFVFGGEISNRTTVYDVASDSWFEATPPPLERNGHSCVVLGTRFYLLGGRNTGGGALRYVETYDPETDTWGELPEMPSAPIWFGAAAADDVIYVAGGLSAGGGLMDTVWEYRVGE